MGLDMYLYRETYVKNWSHDTTKYKVTVEKDGQSLPHIGEEAISTSREEVMYWRKANAIHNWFVQNVQQGVDDCGNYEVSIKVLKELKKTCSTVLDLLKDKPKGTKRVWSGFANGKKTYKTIDIYEDTDDLDELLPPTAGFFFGEASYTEYYKEELERTVEELTKIINDHPDDLNVWYEYSSSW